MGDLMNYRRKLLLLILFFLVIFAFAAMGSEWIGWVCTSCGFYVETEVTDALLGERVSTSAQRKLLELTRAPICRQQSLACWLY